ncbi:MAG TPA: glycosyltransferase family 39 protein [Acidimicrobiia bacterium]|jgi:mannosyltransferase|nr:glycosyltransferase family 39 protein [Acidimicrobiia bacterium]
MRDDVSAPPAVASPDATESATPAATPRVRLAVAGCTVLAFVLGSWHLQHRSLSHEEAFTWAVVDQSFPALVSALVRHEGYQMLHALVLWPLNRVSSTVGVLRLPSVVAFAAAVPAVWLAGRKLFDDRVALLAALLFALNGFALDYGQEARGYMLATALCAWSAAFLAVYALGSERRGARVGWIAFGALAIYAHGFAVLAVGAQVLALWFLPAERRRELHWIRNGALIALCAAPAILAPMLQVNSTSLGTNSRFGMNELKGLVWALAGRTATAVPSIGLGVVIALVVALGVARRGLHSTDAFRFALVILWALLPTVVLASWSFFYPVWLERYVIWSVTAVVLLAAYGLTRIAPAGSKLAVVVVVLAAALSVRGVVKWYSAPPDQDWRSAMVDVTTRARPGDSIIFSPDEVRLSADFFLRSRSDVDRLTPAFPSQPWGHFHTGDEKIKPVPQSVIDALLAHPTGRVWFVTYTMPTVNTARVNELLARYEVVSDREYVGPVEVKLLTPR